MTLGDSAGTQSNYCLNTPLPLLVVQANTKEIKDVIFFSVDYELLTQRSCERGSS
jgi:hypothetical protein